MTSLYDYLQRSPLTATLNQDDAIYLAPHIPHNKIYGALASYIPAGTAPEQVLLLVDDTVFGGAKEGLVITEQAIYYKESFESSKRFLLKDIKSIHYASGFLNGGLFINGNRLMDFTQPKKHSLKILAQLVADFVAQKAQDSAHNSTWSSTSTSSRSSSQQRVPDDTDWYGQIQPMADLLIFFSIYQTHSWNTASVRFIRHCFRTLPEPYMGRLQARMKEMPFQLTTTFIQLGKVLPIISKDSRKQLLQWVIQLMLINEFSKSKFNTYLFKVAENLNLSSIDVERVIDMTDPTCAADWDDSMDQPCENQHGNTATSTSINSVLQQACEVLGLQPHSLSIVQVQQAYRSHIAEYHPDKYQGLPASVRQLLEQKAQQINDARDVLLAHLAH